MNGVAITRRTDMLLRFAYDRVELAENAILTANDAPAGVAGHSDAPCGPCRKPERRYARPCCLTADSHVPPVARTRCFGLADRVIVDLVLRHVPKDQVEGAYNRLTPIKRRQGLVQIRADLIAIGRRAAADLLTSRRRETGKWVKRVEIPVSSCPEFRSLRS